MDFTSKSPSCDVLMRRSVVLGDIVRDVALTVPITPAIDDGRQITQRQLASNAAGFKRKWTSNASGLQTQVGLTLSVRLSQPCRQTVPAHGPCGRTDRQEMARDGRYGCNVGKGPRVVCSHRRSRGDHRRPLDHLLYSVVAGIRAG